MCSPFNRGRPNVWCENENRSSDMPKKPGAYRIVRVDDRTIDYIGITSNLYNRLSNHRSTNKQYDPLTHRVEYQEASSEAGVDATLRLEARKIGVHRAPLNKTSGKNGRIARSFLEEAGRQVEVKQEESIEDAIERGGLLDRFLG